jgi:hypothetical protein
MVDKFWFKDLNKKYYSNQIINPKESTKYIFKIFKKKKLNNLSTLDLACGNGANLILLKKKFDNKKKCLGLDVNKNLLSDGSVSHDFKDLELKYGNILRLNRNLKNKFQLITSFQTLSWLNDYHEASMEIMSLNSKYIFISSLFWEGLIDFKIKLNFLKDGTFSREKLFHNYYNIYSLNNFLDLYEKNNYKKILCKKFEIKKNLYNIYKKRMGTYTIKKNKKKIQMSGPILMNWYFIIFKKVK